MSKGYGEPNFQGFQHLVVAAGTREIFAVGDNARDILSVTIRALSTNTNKIYLGGPNVAAATCIDLDKDQSFTIELSDYELRMGHRINLAKLWIDAAVSGEGVNYFTVKE